MKFLILVLLIFSILSCSENNIVSTPTNVPEPTPTNVPSPSKKDMTIDISGFTFQKSEISIEKDTTVTWQNKDSSMHTASSLDYKFDSGYLNKNEQFSFKFINAGVYTYRCNLHTGMRGVIKVFTSEGALIDPTPTPTPTPSAPLPQPPNNSNYITPPSTPSGSSGYGY